MKLWSALYLMIWLVFLEIWLAFTPIAPPVPYYLHIFLGIAIIGLAYRNYSTLRETRAPGRVKRIAQATFNLSLLMAVLGFLLYLGVGSAWPLFAGISVEGVVRFIHFINAMAIITQASAAAIAYDMWEDREFLRDTQPGEVPAAPPPGVSASP